MRARLLRSMLAVAVLAVVGFGVPLALIVQARYHDLGLLRVQEEAAWAVSAVPVDFARTGDLPELPAPTGGTAVGLYGTSGRLLVGTGPAIAPPSVSGVLGSGIEQVDRRQLMVVAPVLEREQVVGAVLASLPPSMVAAQTHRAWALMAGLGVAVVAAAGGVAVERSRRLARPLARLRSDAEVIGGGGEVDTRAPSGIGEIDDAHEALADAARRLNAAMARERAFTADVAHQLRTPLASLRLRLETEQLRGGTDDALLESALVDVDRLQQTIDDLVRLDREGRGPRENRPLAPMLEAASRRWAGPLQQAGRGLTLLVDDPLPGARVSTAAVRQILDVLLDNALTHGDGTVQLSGRRAGGGVVVVVRDQGTVVLDPAIVFQRRHPGAKGSGIGLALARRLAEAEGMELVVADPGPGAEFHLVVASEVNSHPTPQVTARS